MEASNEVTAGELEELLLYMPSSYVIGLNRMNDLPVYNKDGDEIGFVILTEGSVRYETMTEVTVREADEVAKQKKEKKEREEKEKMDKQPDPNDDTPKGVA